MKLRLFHNYLLRMFRNKGRLALTLSGLTISVTIFMIAIILTETVLENEMYTVNLYKKNGIVVADSDVDYDTYQHYKYNEKYAVRMEVFTNTSQSLRTIEYDNDIPIEIMAEGVLVDENWNESFLPQKNGHVLDRYNSELLYGRLIDEADIINGEKVVVIDDVTSKLIFGKTDAVGEIISFYWNTNEGENIYMKYKVIGIIKSSVENAKLYERILDALDNGKYMEVFNFFVYMPYTSGYYIHNLEYCEMKLVFNSLSGLGYKELKDELLRDSITYDTKLVNIYNADDVYAERVEEISTIQDVTIKVMIIVFLIAGLCIANTMFFSVKERINEIGIRKAIGAFDGDILVQFIFEGIMYGLISGIIGIVISVSIVSSAYYVFEDAFRTISNLIISKEVIMMSMMTAILVSIVSSIIPAIYASRVKISDAIKFD